MVAQVSTVRTLTHACSDAHHPAPFVQLRCLLSIFVVVARPFLLQYFILRVSTCTRTCFLIYVHGILNHVMIVLEQSGTRAYKIPLPCQQTCHISSWVDRLPITTSNLQQNLLAIEALRASIAKSSWAPSICWTYR